MDAEPGSGQDESTVRPYTEAGALNPAERMFVVRGVFTFGDGTKMTGYFTPPVRGQEGLGTMQPVSLHFQGKGWRRRCFRL